MAFHFRLLLLLLSSVYVTVAMYGYPEDISGPPAIETHPREKIAYGTVSALLPCAVMGHSSDMKYKWRKDDQELVLTPEKYQIVDGDLKILDPKRPEDEGKYQCVACNDYGAEISLPTYLRIAYTEPFDRTDRLPIVVNEGDTFRIRCNPPDHYPPAKYNWYKGAPPQWVKPDQRIFISSKNGDLFFSYATLQDAGNYSCVLSGDHQSSPGVDSLAHSPVTSVIVRPGNYTSRAPHIVLSPQEVHAVEGQTVTMQCFYDSYPVSRTVWKRRARKEASEELLLPSNAVLQSDNHVLVLPNIRRDSAGYYFCEVENGFGRITMFARLSINVPAKVTARDTNIPLRLGKNVTLKVTFEGASPLTVTWYRNAEVVVTNRKYVIQDDGLIVTDVEFTDRGRYQCMVQNEYGVAQVSFNLVAVEPAIVKPMQAPQTAMLGENTTVSVRWEASPPYRISWTHRGVILVSVDEHQTVTILNPRMNVTKEGWLSIHDVMADDEGNYTFSVSNDFGNTQASNSLRVIIPPTTVAPVNKIPVAVVIIVVVILLITTGVVMSLLVIRKKRRDRVQSPSRPDAVIVRPNEAEAVRIRLYIDDKIECDEDFETDDTRALTTDS